MKGLMVDYLCDFAELENRENEEILRKEERIFVGMSSIFRVVV
jgi:hypothetical protein